LGAQGVGFRAVQLYGNFGRAAFDPANSPLMIWVLEKAANQTLHLIGGA
jgi:hypothetical protein